MKILHVLASSAVGEAVENHCSRGHGALKVGALIFLSAVFSALVICFLAPGRFFELALAPLVMVVPVGLVVMAVGSRRLGVALKLTLTLLTGLLLASVWGLIVLRGGDGQSLQLGGIPAVLMLQIAGLWLLPFAVVAIGYALSFADHGLKKEDLTKIDGLRSRSSGQ